MVSFFGLRFGGDKKKAQKQPDKKQLPHQEQQQQQQQQQQEEQQCSLNTLVEIQLPGQDPSQPQRRLSRPGTSNSTTARNTNWRTAFSDLPAAASCIDLSTPHRQPSTGSRSLFLGSETSRPGGSGGIASLFSGNKESCLGVPVKVQSPLSQLQFDIQGREEGVTSLEMERDMLDFENGLPSPPSSVGGGDGLKISKVRHQSVVVASFQPEPLPSPAPSAPQSIDDKREIPVIRNVKAKRDTLTFHSPRRQSFIMAIEEANKERNRLQQSKALAIDTAPRSASFDASSCGSLGMELMQSPVEMAEPQLPEEDLSEDIAAEQREQQPDPNAELFGRIAPKGFNSRMRSDTRSRGPPQPLRPLSISTNMLSTTSSGSVADRPLPSPLASKTPMVGDFPVDNGLPRGRRPLLSPMGVDQSTRGKEKKEEGEKDDQSGESIALPSWDLDNSQPRRSAMPAPLFPSKPAGSPAQQICATPTVGVAPRLPSPSFATLEKVTSHGSVEVRKSFESSPFEISFDIPQTSPITCDFPMFGDGH